MNKQPAFEIGEIVYHVTTGEVGSVDDIEWQDGDYVYLVTSWMARERAEALTRTNPRPVIEHEPMPTPAELYRRLKGL